MDNGLSLQKINGSWVSATPTPGEANQESSNNNNENNNEDNIDQDSGGGSTSSNSLKKEKVVPKKVVEEPKYVTEIIAPKIVFAGLPFKIDSKTTGLEKEKVIIGKYVWNFGDGMSSDMTSRQEFEYTYNYPGEYVLTLNYFDRPSSMTGPDASDRVIIKVMPDEVAISSVGTSTDPYVEIENKSAYEVSLSKWVIVSAHKYFIIPEGTTLLPKKKIKFSPKITSFTGADLGSVVLTDRSGAPVATYPVVSSKNMVRVSSNSGTSSSYKVYPSPKVEENVKNDIINLDDLGASAGDSVTGDLKVSSSILIYLGLCGIIIISILIVLLVKKKKYIEFEEDLQPDDIKLVE